MIISGFTACFLTLLLTGLSLNVSRLRMRHQISYGHGSRRDLEVAIRAHGNGLEQGLLFLLLLVIAELLKAPANLLFAIAVCFVVARILHAAAIFGRWLLARQIAHVISLLMQLATSGVIFWKLM